MDYPYFRSLMYHSANQYLDYLEYQFSKGVTSAGRNVVAVWDIQPGTLPTDFYLTTAERIVQPDHCQIWVRGILQENIRILQVLKSHGRTHNILIRDEGNSLKEFGRLYPHDIQIISDMTFLIRRLQDFYLNHEFSFEPPMPPTVPELPDRFTEGLSNEQLAAVNGVFTAPVSYINGAPGTGKTRMVMSRCVLRYILNGKRVFLLAPTNNAVEQMLRSILPVLKESGIDLEKVYRIGTSTEEFASEYPQVTADASIDTLRESLTEQKNFLETKISEAKKFQTDYESQKLRLELGQVSVTITEDFLRKLVSLRQERAATISDKEKAQQLVDSLNKSSVISQKKLDSTSLALQSCKQTIANNSTLADKLSYRLWRKKQRQQLLEDNIALQRILSNYQAQQAALDEEVKSVQTKLDAARNNYSRLEECENNVQQKESTAIKNILSCTEYDSALHKIAQALILSDITDFSALDNFIAKLTSDVSLSASNVSEHPLAPLLSEYENVTKQLDNIATSSKQLQRQNALVFAGTIDASLKTLIPEDPADRTIPVSHVFLDEAGYTSLARGMAAFSCGAPVTFLGDHRQLPPICEMNNINPNNAPVCLWALSIAYYHELVCGNFMELYNKCYCHKTAPSFNGLSRFSLNLSYRFGRDLANILAKFIYDEHFHGVAGAPFEIEVIDAPYSPSPYKRSSISEASEILHYVKSHPNDDIAILAPYRGQIKLLTETLPSDFKESILTVHRSQGREWDTVILSVVDTRNPYFVDSMLPIGQAVLNTAISRTRRKLVLVCDTTSWLRKNDQIITSLIQYAQSGKIPYNL